MRQYYIPNERTKQLYKSALNNDYGYIYNVQSGGGIGGFLKKMLNYIIPIGKSILHKGFEMAKPEMGKLVNKGAKELGKFTSRQIEKRRKNLQKRIGGVKRRKKDVLS